MHLQLCAVRETGFTKVADEMVHKVSTLGELHILQSLAYHGVIHFYI